MLQADHFKRWAKNLVDFSITLHYSQKGGGGSLLVTTSLVLTVPMLVISDIRWCKWTMNNMGILEDLKIKPLSSALSDRNSSKPYQVTNVNFSFQQKEYYLLFYSDVIMDGLGGLKPTQNLGVHLILFQPGRGQIMTTTLMLAHLDLKT